MSHTFFFSGAVNSELDCLISGPGSSYINLSIDNSKWTLPDVEHMRALNISRAHDLQDIENSAVEYNHGYNEIASISVERKQASLPNFY